ncbi:hypothetical protein [Streptomyces sp. CoT10]|uniref:hypothetical protein n=1 Tax=Streptomyces sp. CoT10 TaxID=2875762 RepID=UPI001CD5CC12|nr:hypothetical protein [Streptomyces sp. CoT10]
MIANAPEGERSDAQVRPQQDADGVSPATLKRAASGAVLLEWLTVTQFCIACFAAAAPHIRLIPNAAELEKLWRTARTEERGTLHLKNPRPEYIADQADFSHALYALYERAGAPPLRQVQHRGGGPLHLPLRSGSLRGRTRFLSAPRS